MRKKVLRFPTAYSFIHPAVANHDLKDTSVSVPPDFSPTLGSPQENAAQGKRGKAAHLENDHKQSPAGRSLELRVSLSAQGGGQKHSERNIHRERPAHRSQQTSSRLRYQLCTPARLAPHPQPLCPASPGPGAPSRKR